MFLRVRYIFKNSSAIAVLQTLHTYTIAKVQIKIQIAAKN